MKLKPEELNALTAALSEIVGEKRVLTGEQIGADYGHDELPGGDAHMPDAVVEVKSAEEISAVLKLCGSLDVPVTVRGAGTGLAGGSVPLNGGIVMSTRLMNSILAYDDENMTVSVQPGVLLQDLKADAEAKGWRYTVDPGEKTATIGGNAATNAGGPSALRFGTTRDNVKAVTAVLPTGEIVRLGGATDKSSSGYNLLQLVLGSEGTLAVISELTLRLRRKAKEDVSLILPFMDTESCIKAAERILKEGLEPTTMEYIDTDIAEFSGQITGNPVFPIVMDGERVGASLLLTFEGDSSDELDMVMEAVADLAEEIECLDILVVDTPALKRDVWAAHDAFHTSMETVKNTDELNMSVPTAKLAEFLTCAKELGAEMGMKVYTYAHAGDGGVHVHVCCEGDKAEFVEKIARYADAAYENCRMLGGSVSSEHGIGYAKKAYLEQSAGAEACALMKRIKSAFDPKGILNPGKVVD